MFPRFRAIVVILLITVCVSVYASVFGTVKAIVHDPQHRPVKDAQITVQSTTSAFKQTGSTNNDGIATILNVPVGVYTVTISAKGFSAEQQAVTVTSDNVQELHFALRRSIPLHQLLKRWSAAHKSRRRREWTAPTRFP
jgi:hypothetical protein